jgi:acyl dehydratase
VVQQVIAGLGFDEMRMHKPVYAGDTLRSLSIVEAARRSKSKPDRGIVIYNTQLINQNDELVFSIKASTLMATDPSRQ